MSPAQLDRYRVLYKESEKRQATTDYELEKAENEAERWAATVKRLEGYRAAEVDMQEWLVSQIGGEP